MPSAQERFDRGMSGICTRCGLGIALENRKYCFNCQDAARKALKRKNRDLIKRGLCPKHPKNQIVRRNVCRVCLDIEAARLKALKARKYEYKYGSKLLGKILVATKTRAKQKGWNFDLDRHVKRITE